MEVFVFEDGSYVGWIDFMICMLKVNGRMEVF